MTKNELAVTKTGTYPPGKRTGPRAPRAIRFSDSEWAGIETTAEASEMAAAEFVRNAAVSLALGELVPRSDPIPPETTAQIERIYRGVYLLATLKRDEMIREGRQDECERIGKDARDSQFSIKKAAV